VWWVQVRLVSARYNLIHDCDEVFNFWEPLHYLLYGYGKQTWEYRYTAGALDGEHPVSEKGIWGRL
jgi:hypothetical protein